MPSAVESFEIMFVLKGVKDREANRLVYQSTSERRPVTDGIPTFSDRFRQFTNLTDLAMSLFFLGVFHCILKIKR